MPTFENQSSGAAPKVVMMCGVAGSGKTTYARSLEAEGYARLSVDEEIWATRGRYGIDYDPARYEEYKRVAEDSLKARLVTLIRDRQNVVVDLSFWRKANRDAYKALIEAHGGTWELIYLRVSPDELRRRLALRRKRDDANAFPVDDKTLARFLHGFEPPIGEGETIVET
jgi:predicted kinase